LLSEAPASVTGPRSPLFTSVRRPPRRRWLRGVKILLGVTLTIVLIAAAVVGVVWAESTIRLGGDDVAALTGDLEALGAEGPSAPDEATTVLVALVEALDETEPRPAHLAGPVALVQVADSRDDVAILALPKELEVAVEDEGDLPLDDVHQRGGLDLLVRGVVDYTGVRIDHAVAASVDALPRLTSALRGTERCSQTGCRVLDADAVRSEITQDDPEEQTLAVAETARGLARQLDATTPLRHPLRSRSVVGVLSDEVVADVSLRGRRLLRVAEAIDTTRPLSVAVLPGLRNPETGRLLVPPEQAEVLFQHLQQGTPLEGAREVDEGELLPEGITVGVLNGTGTAGLAGRIESQLQGAGFAVAGTDNASSFDVEQTLVTYNAEDPAAEVAAILVAEQLDGAELEGTDSPLLVEGDPVDVQVTIGADLDDEDEA
jgi:hypothetical protein